MPALNEDTATRRPIRIGISSCLLGEAVRYDGGHKRDAFLTGYLKEKLDRESKVELLAAIEDYRRELVPLIVPITLLRHYVRVQDVAYLAGQLYLEPHPKELMLRNHV